MRRLALGDRPISRAAAFPGAAGSPVSLLDLPEVWSRGPVTIFVHGESRALVNLVMYGLIEWTTPDYSWIDVRIRNRSPTGLDPVALGAIPSGRIVVVDRLDEMAPDPIRGNAVWSVIRSDEPPDSMRSLSDFVRLPRPVQQALALTGGGTRPGAVALSNAHRLVALYDGTTVPDTLRTVVALGASLFVSFADEAPDSRYAFDFVLKVDGASPEVWSESELIVEKSTGPAEGLRGMRAYLGDLAPLHRLISRAVGRGTTGSVPE